MHDSIGADSHAPSSEESPSSSNKLITVVVRLVLYCSLVAAIAVVAVAVFRETQEQAYVKAVQERLVAAHGLVKTSHKGLSPEYTDASGRLVADPPADPAQWVDPETIVLAHYIDADVETQSVDWEGLRAELAAALDKPVVTQEYRNTVDEVANIKSGKTQLVALHAADAPYVVNHAGFVPFAMLGTDEQAHGNHLDIAVPAKSPLQSLAELRGHTLTCTRPDSITGYRAAIAVLSQEAGMRPDVDYFINWSLGQRRSIQGLVEGEFEVAALSNDKVLSMVEKGDIRQADVRIIYQSQVIPRLTIGYFHKLKPELAERVKATVLGFKNEQGAAEEEAGKPMHFFEVDYKRDFEFVRKIDDSFDPRFREAPKEQTAPDLAASPGEPDTNEP